MWYGSFKGVYKKFQECFKEIKRVFYVCLKSVPRKFKGCFKEISRVFKAKLMLEGKEMLLEKLKANGTIFELNYILSKIFISEWTLSLRSVQILHKFM